MVSSPLGSSTESVCSPHSTVLRGLAACLAASSDAAKTITRGGGASNPCLQIQTENNYFLTVLKISKKFQKTLLLSSKRGSES